MADNDDTPTQSDGEKVLHKFDDLFHGHKQATQDELAKMRRELEKVLSEGQDETKKTVNELKDALSSVTEFIEGEKKARSQKDKAKESESTIVVPPNDVTPPQPQGEPEEQSFNPSDEGGKKGGWRKFW